MSLDLSSSLQQVSCVDVTGNHGAVALLPQVVPARVQLARLSSEDVVRAQVEGHLCTQLSSQPL